MNKEKCMLKKHGLIPYISIMLSVLFWGLSFVGTKVALESFAPFSLIFLRFSGASCFFLALMLYRGFPKLTRKEHGRLFLAALFQPGLYFLCETVGLQYTSASKASLIVATIPIAVLGLSAIFLKERFGWMVIFGIGLSLIGVMMLIFGDPYVSWSFGGPMAGDLLMCWRGDGHGCLYRADEEPGRYPVDSRYYGAANYLWGIALCPGIFLAIAQYGLVGVNKPFIARVGEPDPFCHNWCISIF